MGMWLSSCSGGTVLDSSRMTRGSPLVVEDADFRTQPLCLVNWRELKTQSLISHGRWTQFAEETRLWTTPGDAIMDPSVGMKGTQPLSSWKDAGFRTRPLSLRLKQPPKHHMQPILKILLDLLMPIRHWRLGTYVFRWFPKWQSMRQLLIGLWRSCRN